MSSVSTLLLAQPFRLAKATQAHAPDNQSFFYHVASAKNVSLSLHESESISEPLASPGQPSSC